jgi:HD-like signal output (HDOD) protein/ActR/RegA family two-component response regulator
MKTVLFVDDDEPMLEALRLRLRRMRNAWEMEFVSSAAEALARFEQRTFDVIVADQRMPAMDGATLLEIVRTRWPRTVRIVLSGYSEPDETLRLVALAHQYVSKPCDPAELENIIERCLALQELLRQPVLQEVVGRMGPMLPARSTFSQLQSAMTSELSSVAEIAALVAQDTVIAAKVLQIVNSGFFRTARRITNIEQAVAYLGLNLVRSVLISADVFSKLPEVPRGAVSLSVIQAHASRCAAVAALLVTDPLLSNDTVLAALTHDIGYWVLAHGCRNELLEARRLAEEASIALDQAERQVLGASHAEIGAYLLGIWGFPGTIVEAVAYHHSPSRVAPQRFDSLAALCIAHALSEPTECQAFAGLAIPHSEVAADYVASVNAPFTWDEARQRVASLLHTERH